MLPPQQGILRTEVFLMGGDGKRKMDGLGWVRVYVRTRCLMEIVMHTLELRSRYRWLANFVSYEASPLRLTRCPCFPSSARHASAVGISEVSWNPVECVCPSKISATLHSSNDRLSPRPQCLFETHYHRPCMVIADHPLEHQQ